jgi:Ca2+-transporting ATPase
LLDLNRVYGGPTGIAHYLKCDLKDGLKRAGDNDPIVAIQALLNKKKGMESKSESQEALETEGRPAVSMIADDQEARQITYGRNLIPPPPSDGIFAMIVGQVKEDVILQVLIVGAIVVIGLGTAICPESGFIEGITILVAVIIVLGVTSGNDWSKDRKFKKLLLLQSDKKV